MNRCQRWTPALLLAVLLAMQSAASNADPPTINAQTPAIGVAASTKPNAEKGDGINFQPLAPGSELRPSEMVRTGKIGEADLVFIDRSNLTVGPTSEVSLDKFVFDPVGSAGQVVMQAPRGEFRFVTGIQDNGAYQLKTPYGTLSVAGHE